MYTTDRYMPTPTEIVYHKDAICSWLGVISKADNPQKRGLVGLEKLFAIRSNDGSLFLNSSYSIQCSWFCLLRCFCLALYHLIAREPSICSGFTKANHMHELSSSTLLSIINLRLKGAAHFNSTSTRQTRSDIQRTCGRK